MRTRSLVMALILVLTTLSAFAQNRPMTIREMARHADLVFVGDTTAVRSEWNSSRTMIFTTVRQKVVDGYAYKGTSPGAEIEWRQAGGQVGNVKTTVHDGPIFVPEERSLLFLVEPSRIFVVPTIAGNLGKVEVTRDAQKGDRVVLWRERDDYYASRISERSEAVSVPLGELTAFLSEEELQ